jgi:pseudouridylate synthase
MRSAVLVCNPVPAHHAMDVEDVRAATRAAEDRAGREGVAGKALTPPFLLTALADETTGRSVETNLALLEENARIAAEIAVALSATRSG